jgi:hypothetical protein
MKKNSEKCKENVRYRDDHIVSYGNERDHEIKNRTHNSNISCGITISNKKTFLLSHHVLILSYLVMVTVTGHTDP